MRLAGSLAIVMVLLLLAVPAAFGAPPGTSEPAPPALPAPLEFQAHDRPGDTGGAIQLTWKDPAPLPDGAMFQIRRAEPPAYEWQSVGEVKPGVEKYVDSGVKDGAVYRYELRIRAGGAEAGAAPGAGAAPAAGPALVSDPVAAHDNWFRASRANSLVANILFTTIILVSIAVAKSGKQIFIRRIAGLNALDEAIGRATEVGKKVLYVPGIQSMDDIQTVASVAILGYVARSTARYGADLDVPNKDPLTFVSARESVRAAYLSEGRPDLFREEMVHYVTYDQFAYTAAVSAQMIREKPAAIFLIGYFFAESLILAETGQSTGAIQIAGQADPTQLPFFVATCDYTLIGEELYAAGAYLTREPVLLGSMRGQDIVKALVILIGIAGIVATSFGVQGIAAVFLTK